MSEPFKCFCCQATVEKGQFTWIPYWYDNGGGVCSEVARYSEMVSVCHKCNHIKDK